MSVVPTTQKDFCFFGSIHLIPLLVAKCRLNFTLLFWKEWLNFHLNGTKPATASAHIAAPWFLLPQSCSPWWSPVMWSFHENTIMYLYLGTCCQYSGHVWYSTHVLECVDPCTGWDLLKASPGRSILGDTCARGRHWVRQSTAWVKSENPKDFVKPFSSATSGSDITHGYDTL